MGNTSEKGTEHILLVDDEEVLAEINRELLEHFGYKVTVKFSSLDALDAFSSEPDRYDLVITDMTMPEMTGSELAEKILSISPEKPVILCTGYNEEITREKAKASGIRDFLIKPFTTDELNRVIRDSLDKT